MDTRRLNARFRPSFLFWSFVNERKVLLTLPVSCCSLRYKMTCEYTWPNHLMVSDRDAVEAIITQHGFQDDVAYGHTKLFVRTPRSLFTLEQERAALIPILVLFLQKVS